MAANEHSNANGPHRVPASQSLGFLTAIVACLVLSIGMVPTVLPEAGGEKTVAFAGEPINPNDAPVASLIGLPGVGPTRARAIIAYRETVRMRTGNSVVFTEPEDLQQVHGIGPGTVAAIRPWLCFEPSIPSS